MSYHDTGDDRETARMRSGSYAGDGEGVCGAAGRYVEHAAGFQRMDEISCKDEVNYLKRDYRDLKKEAKAEYKQARDLVTKDYEQRVVEAKREYLEDSVSLRERFQNVRDKAREEYRNALDTAKNEYELTVDIAKDQYKTLRKETTKMYKKGKKGIDVAESPGPRGKIESAPTRVIMRLDEEIRKVSAKKAETELAGRKDTIIVAERQEIG